MKKIIFSSLLICFCLMFACAASNDNKSGKDILTDKGTTAMKINILINGKTNLTAALYDNSSAKALLSLLEKGAVTIDMHDYGNFEKVGELPETLPRNDVPLDTDAGDLILYLGRRFVIYYDKNSWTFTPLGRLENVTKAELKKILGTGNVTAVLSAGK